MKWERITTLFKTLQLAGIRPPAILKGGNNNESDKRLANDMVRLWATMLEELTDEELEQAAMAYLQTGEPWWPVPGKLIELVDHMAESREAWDSIVKDRRASLFAELVAGRVDVLEPIPYRQAYRQAKRVFLATPREERKLLDERKLLRDERGQFPPRLRADLDHVFGQVPRLRLLEGGEDETR